MYRNSYYDNSQDNKNLGNGTPYCAKLFTLPALTHKFGTLSKVWGKTCSLNESTISNMYTQCNKVI